MSTVTTTTLSAEMKTFYDMRLIDEASPMLVHEQFGQKRPIPQGGDLRFHLQDQLRQLFLTFLLLLP